MVRARSEAEMPEGKGRGLGEGIGQMCHKQAVKADRQQWCR